MALLFGTATFLLYFFIDLWHSRSMGAVSGVTALTFVLLLLLNVNWLFITFWRTFSQDRFRVPCTDSAFVLFALMSGSDRLTPIIRFPVKPIEADVKEAVSPGEVLRARANKPIVVIATAGGGDSARLLPGPLRCWRVRRSNTDGGIPVKAFQKSYYCHRASVSGRRDWFHVLSQPLPIQRLLSTSGKDDLPHLTSKASDASR